MYKPSTSVAEFTTGKVISGAFKMKLFTPFSKQVRKYFKDKKLIQLMEFPVLFLGAKPDKIPSLYSLMNYADLKLGTWYPDGGMNEIVQAMEAVAKENGVTISLGESVKELGVTNGQVESITTDSRVINGCGWSRLPSHRAKFTGRKVPVLFREILGQARSCTIVHHILLWGKQKSKRIGASQSLF